MNAVNWLKRLSLSSQPSPPPTQQPSHSNTHSNQTTSTTSAPALLAPAHAKAAPQRQGSAPPARDRAMHVGVRSVSASASPSPLLLQADMIDAASPLSLLAATSKLTTFPYGELQALNARMHLESKLGVNGVNGHNPVAGANRPSKQSGRDDPGARELSSQTIVVQQRQKLRSKGRIASIAPTNLLLPSAMPPPSLPAESTALIASAFDRPAGVFSSTTAASQRPLRNVRNVTLLPKTRSEPISHKKSASLSSTQSIRSSKRLKTHHEPSIASTTPTPSQPETPKPAASNKRRVLPARQGHIDILDGEISLLSTPQRLDNRPTFEPSHKIILVDDTIPSTPTTRYEPFSPTTIPDPNTSPTTTRPQTIEPPKFTIRTLRLPAAPATDPLPDTLFTKAHRRHEFTEIRLRNREREKIDYECSLVERQLAILRSEDWRKIVAPAAAEREGLREGETWDWEGRRERRIGQLEGVLKRVRTWREMEIKLRKGMLEDELDESEEEEEEEEEDEEVVEEVEEEETKRRRRKGSVEVVEDVPRLPRSRKRKAAESVDDDVEPGKPEGEEKTGRRAKKAVVAFGQQIPKYGLRNREFRLPKDWIPEEKKL